MATQTQDKEPVPEVIAAEMAKDREVRREERQALTAIPAADLTATPTRTSFAPQSMGEAMQLATIMSRGTFVPGHCRGNEGNCLAIIMQSSRWGMDPFAVANKAYFVKDGAPPAFEAQLVNAVVNSSGALAGRLRIVFEGEGEKLRCTVSGFLRADPSDEKVRTQSIARISTRNSPLWKSDPEQQLAYYTTRAWARLHCPEVLLGVYTPDEVEAEPVRTIAAERPRRPQIEHHQTLAEELGDEIPAFDKQTGEITEQRGMTEVDEDTARELDARTDNDGTLSDDNPAAAEGPADEDRGEGHAYGGPAWLAQVRDIRDRLGKAATVKAVTTIEQDWLNRVRVMVEDEAQVRSVENDIASKKREISAAWRAER